MVHQQHWADGHWQEKGRRTERAELSGRVCVRTFLPYCTLLASSLLAASSGMPSLIVEEWVTSYKHIVVRDIPDLLKVRAADKDLP